MVEKLTSQCKNKEVVIESDELNREMIVGSDELNQEMIVESDKLNREVVVEPNEPLSRLRRVRHVNSNSRWCLGLAIHYMEGVDGMDKLNNHLDVKNRRYHVISWIDPMVQRVTDGGRVRLVKQCVKEEEFWLPQVRFNKEVCIPSNNSHGDLKIEVVRIQSRFQPRPDPGPSNGEIVVGRVLVPFSSRTEGLKKLKLTRVVNGEVTSEGSILVTIIKLHDH